MDRGGSSNAPRGSSLGCLVAIGSGGILERGFTLYLNMSLRTILEVFFAARLAGIGADATG
jgi:hypothetical protein